MVTKTSEGIEIGIKCAHLDLCATNAFGPIVKVECEECFASWDVEGALDLRAAMRAVRAENKKKK